MAWLYFHRVSPRVSWLDHRIVREVAACLAAMMSRSPGGGIEQRYAEMVEAAGSEEALTVYPIPEKVKGFLDNNVAKYGHSSILELTGHPVVFVEHISRWFAWLTFENPLVKGQETSTRAIWREDWKAGEDLMHRFELGSSLQLPQALLEIHNLGLAIAREEIGWWKHEFSKGPLADPQPFRPAFDRARWALPGSIETGVSHAADLRTMSRVIRLIENYAAASDQFEAWKVVAELKEAYGQALPGMRGMGLKEAVYVSGGEEAYGDQVPGNVFPWRDPLNRHIGQARSVMVRKINERIPRQVAARMVERAPRKYLDPLANGKYLDPLANRKYLDPLANMRRFEIAIPCSMAAATDWHRHRSVAPWVLQVPTPFGLHGAYEPRSDFGRLHTARLFELANEAHQGFVDRRNYWCAMASLPLGAGVTMAAQGGEQFVTYMSELRRDAKGANFEYQQQAAELCEHLGLP